MNVCNPLPIAGIGDPFVLKAEGGYWLYATSAPDGFLVWRSDDLSHWGEPQMCYQKTARSFGSKNFWAPEVYAFDGKYYMYYTAQYKISEDENLQLGVAVADRPEGPFADVYDGVPMTDFGFGVLDGHVLCEAGKKYLYFSCAGHGHFVNGYQEADIYVVRLSDDGLHTEGEPVLLLQTDQEWERACGLKQYWNEGPFVLKHNGKFHLMYSANFFGSKYYGVGAAVADDPLGPFVKYAHNPVLSFAEGLVSGPGHNSVVEGPDGELYCVYHAHTDYNRPGGDRQVYIDRMIFDENGFIKVLGPTKG